ncbi:YdeI/OmpD-associated family protein [Niabella aurantiaca]|uniref:YdeI/OmpD-associated family protein n=1 Tax=Niabella aurantiaca TaxID=379900 RepID=UPI00036E73F0|nr:YdeI/OmpD-associated family protein [Niabella aurantiaca]
MEIKDGKKVVLTKNRTEWRNWLLANHDKESSVWLVLYHKGSSTPSVEIAEAMEEALCFGWIDSKAKKRDKESFYLTFSQRKPQSNWSNINKERADRMIKLGLMTQSGQRLIDLAKKTGTWDALTDVQNLVVPADLQELFNQNRSAFGHFEKFSPSSKRVILEWIQNAKKPETRQRRIVETVRLAAENRKANHSRQ